MRTISRYLISFFVGSSLIVCASSGCNKSRDIDVAENGDEVMEIKITSTVFEYGNPIPSKYAGQGQDISPPLNWSDPPEQTAGFALICDDPDAPVNIWVHWVIYNIPADSRGLAEAVPTHKILEDGSMQGITDFGRVGYGGPMPPSGLEHRYFFKLYALDEMLDLEPGATKAELVKAMQDHVLAQGVLMGTYKR